MFSKKDILEKHELICEEARKEMKSKNEDYSHGEDGLKNFKSYNRLGICSTEEGILSRMTDKMVRLIHIAQKGERSVEEETVNDTIRDLINYAILLDCSFKDESE